MRGAECLVSGPVDKVVRWSAGATSPSSGTDCMASKGCSIFAYNICMSSPGSMNNPLITKHLAISSRGGSGFCYLSWQWLTQF